MFDSVRKMLGFSATEKSGTANPSSWLVSALGGGPTDSGVNVSAASSLRASTVLACVRILSEDVAKLGLGIYKRKPDGSREDAKEHPLWPLLRFRPNNWQDPYFWVEVLQMSLVMRGNAYAFTKRDARGRILEMIPISPDRVTLYEAPGGDLFYGVSRGSAHEVAQLEDAPYMIPASYMLHLRWMSRDGLTGISPIDCAREPIGLSLVQEKQAAKMARNGARPGGVLKIPGKLSPEAAARLKASWDAAYGGGDSTGKTAVLEEGVAWEALTLKAVDAQFLEQRKYQVEEICRVFGVPPHKVGELSRSTNNNIESQTLSYYTDTLMPWLERWESAMGAQLLSAEEQNAGYFFEFDTRRLLRGDVKTQMEAYRYGRQWGWLSVNEIRIDLGMDPVEGGDVRLQPMNMQPLGEPQEDRPNIPGDVPKASIGAAVAKALMKRQGGQND